VKTNPNPENPGGRTKSAGKGALPDSRSDPRNAPEPCDFEPTTFSQMNEVNITKTDIWRTAEAIKRAGCRDVLIVYTPDFVRFIVTIELPKAR
jgi:hypothetical protein